MKKFYFALIALLVFVLSGCGGGSSSFTDRSQISPDVKQVMVLNSPAFERHKRYQIYKGVKLSGMNGARYYISNTGSEAVQSTLNLGFSEALKANEPFIVVNYVPDYETHPGEVVFAYDPSANNDDFISGKNISFTGGRRMRYTTLSLSESVNTANDNIGHYDFRPRDADEYKEYKSERGITKFAIGSGSRLSFVEEDEDSDTPREVPSSGNIFQLERRVNTFSGIVSGY